jgi:protein SCO1
MCSVRALGSIAALLVVVALSGCGASASPPAASQSFTADGHGLQGLILKPEKSAPALALHNYTGQPVSLATMRGKAVLVTFVYTHCPNVCPLIVSKLAAADRSLGPEARHLELIAVTVDPRRDTPTAIRTFLQARGALGRMYYLLGSHRQLVRTWKAWGVGINVDTKHVIEGHTSLVYGVTATGKLAVVYPSNFTPQQIIHDVPLLART